MNPRFAKEIHPLLFPWCVCALAGFASLIGLFSQGALVSFLMSLPAFAFFGGCLLLAVLPFGSEFQHRTLPLLLAQPLDRSRLWREKFLTATAAVLALVVVYVGILIGMGERISLDDSLPYLGFVVATICSAGLCALKARSIIGGIAFSICSQFLVLVGVSGITYFCYKLIGREPGRDEWPITMAYVAAGVTYSAFTLWLGWKTFVRMEVRDAPASANVTLPGWMTPRKLATLLRCQPVGGLRNLIRKELCLQKPIFTIAAIFGVCWFTTLLLFALRPLPSLWNGILNGLTAVHVVIVVLLAGCVSLGEEKSLGLSAWHLTLPVSTRRQWIVKLAVSTGVLVLAGLVLPWLLSWMISLKTNVGLASIVSDNERIGLVWTLFVLLAVFAMSFWSASLWRDTVRSVVATVLSAMGVIALVIAAAWCSEHFFRQGLQTDLIRHILIQLPDSPATRIYVGISAFTVVVLVAVLAALVQSLAQFRRTQTPNATKLKYSFILAALVFLGSFWCSDLLRSM